MSLRVDQLRTATAKLSDLAWQSAKAILELNYLDTEDKQQPRDWTNTFHQMIEAGKLVLTASPAEIQRQAGDDPADDPEGGIDND